MVFSRIPWVLKPDLTLCRVALKLFSVKPTKREGHEVIHAQLKQELQSFIPMWRDINDVLLPTRGKFFVGDSNKGDRRNTKIYDSTATFSCNTLASGMLSGVTSPARPWFRLTTPDPDLAEFGRVKNWLHTVAERMGNVFLKSNLYYALPIVYGDMGGFGTSAFIMERDPRATVGFYPFAIGRYMIAVDSRGRANTFFREFRMTVRQLVEKFGVIDEKTGKPKWENFSEYVKTLWDQGEYEQWVEVNHIIQPNVEFNPYRLESKFKRFESCYYESGRAQGHKGYIRKDDEGKYLSEKGYDYFPVLTPRWGVNSEDVYGTFFPGSTALGDIRQLQKGESRSLEVIEKKLRPAMIAPTSLRNQKVSILPGDVTFDDREQNKGFRPAHEVNLSIAEIEQKQEQVRIRIRRAFYEDLFLMLQNDRRSNITAREIEERHEEKLLVLGPVLEQLNKDCLNPLVDNTYYEMEEAGMIPEAPEELNGVELKIEYISVMAQAQKLVAIGGLNSFTGYVQGWAAVDPRVLDKVDTDQMIDEYGNAVGVSPRVIRTDEDAAAIRTQRDQAQQAQVAAETMKQGAGAVKELSQADLGGDNALSQLMNQAQAGQMAEAI